jgi:hypothetical protein
MSMDIIFGRTCRDWSRKPAPAPIQAPAPLPALAKPAKPASLPKGQKIRPTVKLHGEDPFVHDETRAQGEDGFAGRKTV